MMYCIRKGTREIIIMNSYIPQGERPEEEKENVYEEVSRAAGQKGGKGPSNLRIF